MDAENGLNMDTNALLRRHGLREENDGTGPESSLMRTLMGILPVGVFLVEAPSGHPIYANDRARELLGRGIVPDADGSNIGEVYRALRKADRASYPSEAMPIIRGMRGESAVIDDMVVVAPDGSERLLEVHGSPLRDDSGRVWASMVCFIDITERNRDAERITALLAEKATLLSEANHRIKNNLQAIRSMLALRAETSASSQVAAALRESLLVVDGIALLYESFARSNRDGLLKAGALLKRVVEQALLSYGRSDDTRAEIDVEDFELDPRRMQALCLVVNELATNACKYSLGPRGGGSLRMEGRAKDGLVSIFFEDDGPGLPEGIDVGSSRGLGLKLVAELKTQLAAEIRYVRPEAGGAPRGRFEIRFRP